jgi:hypothetical protein
MNSTGTFQLAPLGELSFAPSDHPWDAQVAAARLKQGFGWVALAAYSLAIDAQKDPESFDAYQLLVVDLVDGEPCVVPAALKAARGSLDDLEGEARDVAERRLSFIEQKWTAIREEESQASLREEESEEGEEGEEEAGVQSEPQDEPRPSVRQSVGVKDERVPEPSAERLAEAAGLVERLAAKGSLLPAWGKDALVQFMAGLSDEKTLSQDGYEPISPVKFFSRLLESLPALIPTQEFAGPQELKDRSFESLGRKIANSLK